MPRSEPDYFTTTELSELIRTPVETLRWWRAHGQGPESFRLGRRVLYRRAAVDAWIDREAAATRRGSVS